MANLGLSENQIILEELCRICGERLKKAKDKYENSFFCADRREVISWPLVQVLQACFKRRHTSCSEIFGLLISDLATVLYAVPTRTSKSLEEKENQNLQ